MSTEMQTDETQRTTVLLVNARRTPDSPVKEGSFQDDWRWVTARPGWQPDSVIVGQDGGWDAIVVFAEKYREDEAFALCRAVRERKELDEIPLLIAIDIYQMPLANKVKRLPNAGFVFAPIDEADLRARIDALQAAVHA
ncbi:MAG: hypothetical protein JXR37_17620 [Kiritimatiellae bacterium]|nr:hypothetical protein [Kiritimatiellia bacterium]